MNGSMNANVIQDARHNIDRMRGILSAAANPQGMSPTNALQVHAAAALLASYDRELDRQLEEAR